MDNKMITKTPNHAKTTKVMLVLALSLVLCIMMAMLVGCTPNQEDPDQGLDFVIPAGEPDPTFGLNGETPTDLKYFKYEEIDEDGEKAIAITGTFTQATELKKIVIPAVIDGKKVTRLYDSALATLYSLEEVVVSGYVVDVRPYVFRDCWSLKTVKFPANLLRLSEGAFQGCKSIEDLSFLVPSIKVLGARVFEGCNNLKSANIPDTVTSIGEYAFLDCKALAEIKFPANMTSIPNRMFQGCTSLEKTIGNDGFVLPSTIKSIGDYAFAGAKFKPVVLPEGLETIGKSAFAGCPRIREVAIPDTVKSIGDGAFSTCALLKEVKMPLTDKVTLGAKIFENSKKVEKITVKAGSKVETYCRDWAATATTLSNYAAITIVNQ